jgi:hypothetical protein
MKGHMFFAKKEKRKRRVQILSKYKIKNVSVHVKIIGAWYNEQPYKTATATPKRENTAACG